jgi:hypothetical protein
MEGDVTVTKVEKYEYTNVNMLNYGDQSGL